MGVACPVAMWIKVQSMRDMACYILTIVSYVITLVALPSRICIKNWLQFMQAASYPSKYEYIHKLSTFVRKLLP